MTDDDEARFRAAEKLREEMQKTGIKIRDELVEPDQSVEDEYVDIDFPGLSRRDYFAAQALAGLLARTWSPNTELTYTALAAHAYSAADAMLEARKK